MKIKRILFSFMAAILLFTAIPFSSVQALTVEQMSTDDTTINVYFHDDGADLNSLNPNEITATLDGNPLNVTNFKQAEQRINYMFLLDISRSVEEEYMTAAKQEILKIYENLNEEDLLSVVTFGSEVHTVLNGDETLEEARAILDGIHCDNDYTHFYDAVDLLLDRLEGTADMRNIAVVVSDGINTGDVNTSIDSLRNRLSGSGVAIYALAVDSAESSAINSFRQFVELSGGELFTFSPETCSASMDSLHKSVDAIWNVAVEVDPALATGETQTLEIKVGEHGTITRDVILEKQVIDTVPPTLTDWKMDAEADTLELHFSEAMADLKNPDHYQITGPDGSRIPASVVESSEDYVLLSIEGLTEDPGWRADFVRLMDASPNRNLIENKTLLITPEIVIEPETPSDEGNTNLPSWIPMDLIMEYWPIFLACGILLLLLIIIGIVYFIQNRRAKRLFRLDESEWMIAKDEKKEETTEEGKESAILGIDSSNRQFTSSGEAIHAKIEEEEAGKPVKKVRRFLWFTFGDKEETRKKAKASKEEKGGKKARRGFFWWLRGTTVIDEAEVSEESTNTDHTLYDYEEENEGRIHMSKGNAGGYGGGGLGGRSALGGSSSDSSSSSNTSTSSDSDESNVHVNAHKRRGGLLGLLLGLFTTPSAPEVAESDYEESGVLVSEHRRGPKTPTTDGDSPEKNPDAYETDIVSEHNKNRKVRRVRRNWFFWKKKKEIPVAEEVKPEEQENNPEGQETDSDTLKDDKDLAAKASEQIEIDEKTARKYVKKRWFWQRKKKEVPSTDTTPKDEEKPAEEETPAVIEDEVDEKTARKYIKPRKEWFKKEIVPVQKQAIPERPAEDPAAETTADAADSTKETSTSDVPDKGADVKYEVKERKSTLTETSIKSGGFSLSGINADYRPSIFNIKLKPDKKLTDVSFNQKDKSKKAGKADKTSKTNKTYTAPSLSGPGRKSSKNKNVNFTFTGNKKKNS